jgi:hypothetical protein
MMTNKKERHDPAVGTGKARKLHQHDATMQHRLANVGFLSIHSSIATLTLPFGPSL